MTSGNERPLLGRMLVQNGEVTSEEVARALDAQAQNEQPIGEILLAWNALCRPALVRVLAEQRGIDLDEERGFGSGLRAEIERRHWLRRPAA